MPRLRMNLREINDVDDLDLIDEVAEIEERDERDERDERGTDGRRVINPVALQRRQDSRKWGKEIAKYHRQNKRLKP